MMVQTSWARAFAVLHAPTNTIARVVWREGYGFPLPNGYTSGQRTDHVELVRGGHRHATQLYTQSPLSLARNGLLHVPGSSSGGGTAARRRCGCRRSHARA